MLEFNPNLTESHFLHSFVNSLQEEIKHRVVMFKPQTLEAAYELAESEERKQEALRRRSSYFRGTSSNQRPMQNRPFLKGSSDSSPNTDPKMNKPTREFKKGEYYKYGEKW